MTRPPRLYDRVRISAMRGQGPQGLFGERGPLVGDTACVIEIYCEPPGYELECLSPQGETEWVASFAAADISLEYLGRA
jgi:hypothetical protein